VSADASPVADRTRRSGRRRCLLWGAVFVIGALAGSLLAVIDVSSSTSTKARIASGPGATAAALRWAAGARPAPNFRLVDERSRGVSLSAYRGRPVIVTFIDPLCRNFCPLEAKQLNDLVRSLPPKARPAILAVSVDVYGDARSNLLQDVAKWRLVPQWRWAVGRRHALAQVWRRYRIGVLVTTKKIAGVRAHEISHTEAAYVVDGHGDERALFMWPFRARDVLATLRQLASSSS
jgi:cytochrome oxidase Cu insertion factor (SCO1/SenC/PrrC family)